MTDWRGRQPGEPTWIYLGRVLDWIGGLGDMPRRAREGHFDDYACPPEVDDGLNIHRLVAELDRRKRKVGPAERSRITAVIEAAKDGEFDGTREESHRWAASADGQAAFRELREGR